MKTLKNLLFGGVVWVAVDLATLALRASGIKSILVSFFINLIPYNITFAIYLLDSIGYFVVGFIIALIIKKDTIQIGAFYVAIEVVIYVAILTLVPEARSDLPSPVAQILLESISASFIMVGCFTLQRFLLRSSKNTDVGEMS